VLRHRLVEEVLGASVDRLTVARQEHDGQSIPDLGQAALQFRTAETGKVDIEQDAACATIVRQGVQQTLARFINCDLVADGTQEPGNGSAKRIIILNDMNDRPRHKLPQFHDKRKRFGRYDNHPKSFAIVAKLSFWPADDCRRTLDVCARASHQSQPTPTA